jgi:pyruvate dehydrogenase E1 component alpha subunit
VEAKTYRFAGHSRADTAPYRRDGELEVWSERDPIRVLRSVLIERGLAIDEDLSAIETDLAERVAALATEVEALPAPGITAMFQNIWAPKEA